MVGTGSNTPPKEPENGIALGEEFTYKVNVYKGIMYLTFTSENHETIKFTKSLLQSEFAKKEDIPQQVITRYSTKRKVGVERENGYAGEINYFKQGAYNQANAKSKNLKFTAEIFQSNTQTEVMQKFGLKKLLLVTVQNQMKSKFIFYFKRC